MPYTAEQRRLFHLMAEDDEVAEQHGTSQKEARKLAQEADDLAREGREKPAKKASIGVITIFTEPRAKPEGSGGFIDLSGVFPVGTGKS